MKMLAARPLLFCAASLLAASAHAQPAARMADLTTVGYTGSVPGGFTQFGNAVYFRASDDANGSELFRTDGTTEGTGLLVDVLPGPALFAAPQRFSVAGGRLLFVGGASLWRTDGTAAGTALVTDRPRDPRDLAVRDGILYFSAIDEAHGRELWRSDGTDAGTYMVKDIRPGVPGSAPLYLVARGDAVYFAAVAAEGDELWRSDGTEAGTVLVRDIRPGPASASPRNLAVAGGTIFFTAYTDAFGFELWTSDGTFAGTTLVADIWPGDLGQGPAVVFGVAGARVYFQAEDGATGREPWTSDGTTAGTFRVADLRAGGGSSEPVAFTAAGGGVYFVADDGTNGYEVWRTDGTSAGTAMLGPAAASGQIPYGLTAFEGALYFSCDDGVHGTELWRADGAALTLLDLNPGPLGSMPDSLRVAGDALYFGAVPVGGDPALSFGEPWISDGTLAGSRMLRALRPAASSSMSYGVAYGGAYYFLLTQPATGFELWRSDGTAAGTQLFLDLWPGPQSGFPASFVVKNGLLYFFGRDAAGAALWRTDGTAGGTTAVKRFPEDAGGTGAPPMVLAGDRLFLVAATSATGAELWTSDGTEAGTVPVADLNTGPSGAIVTELTALGDRVVFRALSAGSFGLWRSDGTAAGTVRLTPASASSSPRSVTTAGGRAFFVEADATHGDELWATDGTVAGTALVRDVDPGPGSSLPDTLAALGASVLFSARDAAGGRELWRSDGTAGGTVRVADIRPGAAGSDPSRLSSNGAFVVFDADDGVSGREPWRTDGTVQGTFRLADVWAGPGSSMFHPSRGAAWGGLTFFAAATPGHGAELWRTDGTAVGTRLVQEIGPGESSAGIPFDGPGGGLTPAAGRLFFRAVDEAGLEPWSLLPELSVSDAAAAEGGTATFTIALEPPVERPVTVAFATADLTATAGPDYAAASGTLTFAPGQASRTVAVTLVGDGLDEGDERFTLTLASPQGAFVRDGTGVGTIVDDDAPPSVSVSDAAVDEGDAGQTTATFTVTRTGSLAAPTVVSYATFDGTADTSDFVHASGDLTFAAGVATRTVDVRVLGDLADEPDERFLLVAGPVSGASIARGVGYGTIRDDDGGAIGLRELAPGTTLRERLTPGPGPVENLYVLVRPPHGSVEVALDEASGDLGDAGPLLQEVAPDLASVLGSSTAAGVGFARSLRLVNTLDVPLLSYVRVRSAGCTTGCGADDVYRLRVSDTTGRIPRFNAAGGQTTVVLLQNRSDASVAARVTYWTDAGGEDWTAAVDVPARGVAVVPPPFFVVGGTGSVTVAHDGPLGALAGKAVGLDPATGLAFDTPLETAPR